MVHEREKNIPLRSYMYISRAVNVGAELNVYGNVRCKLCDMKAKTIQKISCNFRKKYKTLQL